MREADIVTPSWASSHPGAPVALPASPLVGRRAELRVLVDGALHAPSVVLLEGEAGVGKSRLVAELVGHPALSDRCVLVGYCCELREPFPFGPVIEALRGAADRPARLAGLSAVAGALRPVLPELADRLPPALPPLGDRVAERHRLFRAVREVLTALGPCVLVLEDLHWSDTSTRDLVHFLTRAMPSRLSLLVTYRGEDLPDGSWLRGLAAQPPHAVRRSEVRLSPLDVDDVRQLVARLVGVPEVSAEFAADLHERTLGVPFAVEEVVRLLADRAVVLCRDRRGARRALDRLELPLTLRHSLLERAARLPADARRVIDAAAVLGQAATVGVLAAVSALGPRRGARAVSTALNQALLREVAPGQYALRHALIGQATYDTLTTPERVEMHARAARALRAAAGPLPLAHLAHHYRQAGQVPQWVHHAEAAADQAIAAGNGSTATDLLLPVLATGALTSTERTRIAVKLGRAAQVGLDHAEAVTVLRRALAEPMPAGVRGELRLNLGLLLRNQTGMGAVAVAELTRAVTELRRRPALAARAMSSLAVPAGFDDGHLSEHLSWLERATESAARSADPVMRAAVLVNRATALMRLGDPRAWAAVADIEKLAAARAGPAQCQQVARAWCNLAHATLNLGHYAAAETFLHRAEERLADTDAPYLTGMAQACRLLLDWAVGRWSGLRERALLACVDLADLAEPAAEARLVAGLLAFTGGELADADRLLRSAAATAPHGSIPVLTVSRSALSRIGAARDDSAAERAEARLTWEVVRRKGIWVWAAELVPAVVEAMVADGAVEAARDAVAEFADGVADRDAPLATASLHYSRGLLERADGRHGEAEAVFGAAEAAYRVLPRPYEAARALEASGECRFADGGDGRGELTAALAGFDRLGAGWDAARCRATLRRHGASAPPRGGRRGYGRQLSPREREVAELAAAGLTNREIAAALFLSPRTVELHVAHAMGKLAVASRRELADAVRGHAR